MSIRVEQHAQRTSAAGWKWSVWLEAAPAELDDVVSVTYVLHPSFPDPIQTITDRSRQFRLDASGWGEFRIRLKIRHRDGSESAMEHDLRLGVDLDPAPRKEPVVFVSSAAADRAVVRDLQGALASENIIVQSASDDVSPGSSWIEQCTETLMGVDAVVALISKRANPWLEQQIKIAKRIGVPIVPVVVGDAEIPEDLRDRQVISVDTRSGILAAASQLTASIRSFSGSSANVVIAAPEAGIAHQPSKREVPMSWSDFQKTESHLNAALESFDWATVAEICKEVIERIRTEPDPFPELTAKRVLGRLRRKCQFSSMALLGEAVLQSGVSTPAVRRQYAQALIDQGTLFAGDTVLRTIVQDSGGNKGEEMEARGLRGRIYKQLYVNYNDPKSARNRDNLESAINEYLHVYRIDPRQYLWHGINVVALAARARRDAFPSTGLPDAVQLAGDILAAIQKNEEDSPEPLPAWDEATRLEALVALGRHEEAWKTASRYVDHPGADEFEIASTLRQMTEVWQLNEHERPGNVLLPVLRLGHLKKSGAMMSRDPKQALAEAAAVGAGMRDEHLEAIFGPDRMVTLQWYRRGLEQCSSVARIERLNGKGHGTGWLVQASDFFPNRQGVLLLTNNHVVSDMPNPPAIFPDDVQVNFQALNQVLRVEDAVPWSSPVSELDATFLVLKGGEPKATPLTLHRRAVAMPPPAQPPAPAPRLYIIGHPAGRDLELSLQDNHLLATNDTVLHYRTPTEPGSSGSPVFEPEDWRVVALHHKGNGEMPRLDGVVGTYEANEGIAILAIQAATKRG